MPDRALLVGINNYQSISDLRGCVNDTRSLQTLLADRFGFSRSNIVVLTDGEANKAEIRRRWRELVRGVQPGDRAVLHFSGHGSYTVDRNGDETDGVDELLCLVDMDWDDPGSYLLDDELRNWTREIPAGVQLTVILDACHSGTGTRMVAPPMNSRRSASLQTSVHVDMETGMRRSEARDAAAGQRGRSAEAMTRMMSGVVPADLDQANRDTVFVRFVTPPDDVLKRIARRGRRSTFHHRDAASDATAFAADDEMNHVLWTGSRSDQTSADAWMDGDFHGAFTNSFCRTLGEMGSAEDSRTVMEEIRRRLRSGGFSQVPQLEPDGASGPVFGAASPSGGPGTGTPGSPSPGTDTVDDTVADEGVAHATIAELRRIAESLDSVVRLLQQQPASGAARAPGTRGLVYCHGICLHQPGYSDPWWQALSPHLSQPLRNQLDSNRHEVLWSHHVTPGERSFRAEEERISATEREESRRLQEQLRSVLEERAALTVSMALQESGDAAQAESRTTGPVEIPRAALGIPGLDCVDDFTKYLASDSIRRRVMQEFIDTMDPLLASGQHIDVISHSWGTVVAYEALRELEHRGYSGRVPNFFTVGSALAISFVRRRVRPNDGRRPGLVDRWINLDAKGDIVGGSLRAVGLAADHEYLDLLPTECSGLGWGSFRVYQPACAHSSYFKPANHVVNGTIFGRWISR